VYNDSRDGGFFLGVQEHTPHQKNTKLPLLKFCLGMPKKQLSTSRLFDTTNIILITSLNDSLIDWDLMVHSAQMGYAVTSKSMLQLQIEINKKVANETVWEITSLSCSATCLHNSDGLPMLVLSRTVVKLGGDDKHDSSVSNRNKHFSSPQSCFALL